MHASLQRRGRRNPRKYDCMISYRWAREDVRKVERIYEFLKAKGLQIWFDRAEMSGDINSAMYEGVTSSAVIVACLSSNYEESKNCKKELNLADEESKQIVPVRLDKGPFTWSKTITAGQYYIPLHDVAIGSRNWDEQMDALYKEIIEKRSTAPETNAGANDETDIADELAKRMKRVDILYRCIDPNIDWKNINEILKWMNDNASNVNIQGRAIEKIAELVELGSRQCHQAREAGAIEAIFRVAKGVIWNDPNIMQSILQALSMFLPSEMEEKGQVEKQMADLGFYEIVTRTLDRFDEHLQLNCIALNAFWLSCLNAPVNLALVRDRGYHTFIFGLKKRFPADSTFHQYLHFCLDSLLLNSEIATALYRDDLLSYIDEKATVFIAEPDFCITFCNLAAKIAESDSNNAMRSLAGTLVNVGKTHFGDARVATAFLTAVQYIASCDNPANKQEVKRDVVQIFFSTVNGLSSRHSSSEAVIHRVLKIIASCAETEVATSIMLTNYVIMSIQNSMKSLPQSKLIQVECLKALHEFSKHQQLRGNLVPSGNNSLISSVETALINFPDDSAVATTSAAFLSEMMKTKSVKLGEKDTVVRLFQLILNAGRKFNGIPSTQKSAIIVMLCVSELYLSAIIEMPDSFTLVVDALRNHHGEDEVAFAAVACMYRWLRVPNTSGFARELKTRNAHELIQQKLREPIADPVKRMYEVTQTIVQSGVPTPRYDNPEFLQMINEKLGTSLGFFGGAPVQPFLGMPMQPPIGPGIPGNADHLSRGATTLNGDGSTYSYPKYYDANDTARVSQRGPSPQPPMTDTANLLSKGWETKQDKLGNSYYVNKPMYLVSWENPLTWNLPAGWDKRYDQNGRPFYVELATLTPQWEPPVSLFSPPGVAPPQGIPRQPTQFQPPQQQPFGQQQAPPSVYAPPSGLSPFVSSSTVNPGVGAAAGPSVHARNPQQSARTAMPGLPRKPMAPPPQNPYAGPPGGRANPQIPVYTGPPGASAAYAGPPGASAAYAGPPGASAAYAGPPGAVPPYNGMPPPPNPYDGASRYPQNLNMNDNTRGYRQ